MNIKKRRMIQMVVSLTALVLGFFFTANDAFVIGFIFFGIGLVVSLKSASETKEYLAYVNKEVQDSKEKYDPQAEEKVKHRVQVYKSATNQEKNELSKLYREERRAARNYAVEALAGKDLYLPHEHSTLKGVATSAVAGPLAGAVVKTVGDMKNAEIDRKNAEIARNNAASEVRARSLKSNYEYQKSALNTLEDSIEQRGLRPIDWTYDKYKYFDWSQVGIKEGSRIYMDGCIYKTKEPTESSKLTLELIKGKER